jgi:hypothetical protein
MFSANTTQVSTAANAAIYIEDVFSTYLYTGNGSTQTITNGIDLSGKGGLVWQKARSASEWHHLVDTARGSNKNLYSNDTSAQTTGTYITSFNSNGYGLGAINNTSATTYVSWTFRKQPKFFDIVTYTGTGNTQTINHNLGSAPGCIFVKAISSSPSANTNWCVYHRGIGNTEFLSLNLTNAAATLSMWGNTNPTSTAFTVGGFQAVGELGGTYVAYLFAHDAGGFGDTGTDNVISCGSFTTDGNSVATVTLGYEPQWVLVKPTVSSSLSWKLVDTMRGWPNNGSTLTSESGQVLKPNTSSAEEGPGSGAAQVGRPFQTGFTWVGDPGENHIYIAIRRGPMKTPTVGTSVFGLNARTGTGANATVTGGQTDDAVLIKNRGGTDTSVLSSRLTGTGLLFPYGEELETAAPPDILQANPWDVMDGVKVGTTSTITNASANTFINYLFRRAPGFFDVVCYTGTGVARTVSHNLGIAPEIYIVKSRTTALASNAWIINCAYLPTPSADAIVLNSSGAVSTGNGALLWNSTLPTASVFSIGTYNGVNTSGSNFIVYLFATVAGVSKVGSYTGTSATLTVNCGFTTGARFVLVKRTDMVGDWYVWDSARGIVAGNDPYLLLNNKAAEVTSTNYVDTDSTGFKVTAAAPAALNASGGTYIFLAIA